MFYLHKIKPVFVWHGIDCAGQRISGITCADSKMIILSSLNTQQITVLKIKRRLFYRRQVMLSSAQIRSFTEQLSQLLLAGISLPQALLIIAPQQNYQRFAQWVQSLKKNIDHGMTLTASLEQYPQHFNAIYCGLVRTGEHTGKLGEMLAALVEHLEQVHQFKNKIRKALYYPTLILIVAVGIFIGLSLFVMPQFQQTFASFQAPLPWLTRTLITLTGALRQEFVWFALSLTILFFTIRYFKQRIHGLLLKLPIIDRMIIMSATAVFTKILNTTLRAGIPLIDALQMAINAIPNAALQSRLTTLPLNVNRGHPLHLAMQQCHLFSESSIQLIRIAESGGCQFELLQKLAKIHQQQLDDYLDTMTSLLEPAIMLILAVFTTLLIVALYLPILQMSALI